MSSPAQHSPDELNRQLARDILTLADVAGMPDSFWTTDSRVERARNVLGIGPDERYTRSEEWQSDA